MSKKKEHPEARRLKEKKKAIKAKNDVESVRVRNPSGLLVDVTVDSEAASKAALGENGWELVKEVKDAE